MSELIKDRECIDCKRLFICKGKPVDTQNCLNYEQRENKSKEIKEWQNAECSRRK